MPRCSIREGLGVLASAVLFWAGCSSAGAAARAVGRDLLRATPEGRRILTEWDRYERIAHVLKKYHDKGHLDESDVMDVLAGAGIVWRPAPRRAGAPAAKAPKPFPVPVYKGGWRWPVDAGVVSSEYGPRWGKSHQGIDIAADRGVPVFAAGGGKVLYAGDRLRGYGNVVILRHDEKTVTLYAHNDALLVKEQQTVRAGHRIALLGSTGRSTGPHLHFELREGSETVDPRKRLPKSRF